MFIAILEDGTVFKTEDALENIYAKLAVQNKMVLLDIKGKNSSVFSNSELRWEKIPYFDETQEIRDRVQSLCDKIDENTTNPT